MARNRLAGTKTGKSKSARYYQENPTARRRKIAYDTKYHSTPSRRRYRSELAKANREAGTHGNGDGLDMAHKGRKIVGLKSQSANRGSKTDSAGDRRARGRKRKGSY
jgi:hypothetical protein